MSLRTRLSALTVTAAILVSAVAAPAFAAEQPAPTPPEGLAAGERPENDNLVPMVLGATGAVAAAAVVAGIGYLYRRQTGALDHYEDGFTPRDPRDHAAH